MATSPKCRDNGEQASLELSLEGLNGVLTEIHVYFFDTMGTLIGRQVVQQGRIKLGPDKDVPAIAHILVGPAIDGELRPPLTLTGLRQFHMFEASFCALSGQRSSVLPIPEAIWRWWLVHDVWAQLRKHTTDLGGVSVLL